MKRNIIKVSVLAATVLSLTSCTLFNKSDTPSVTASPVVTHSGIAPTEKGDTLSNNMAWSDISAKLPRNFPEITINGSSNINNLTSEYGIISVTWTNMTSDNLTEIKTFLEEKLSTTFEENGDVISASDVELSGTKYIISLSFSDDSSPAMITMNISTSSEKK